MNTPAITLVEMSPRDGLQNEPSTIDLCTKIELVNRLSACGLQAIEAGSFVSPKWVPQMANSRDVFAGIQRKAGVVYSALTPNIQGFEQAMAAKADEIAVFAAASEAFSLKNLNCDIETSLTRFEPVLKSAQQAGIRVRGYVSCILGCPYQEKVSPQAVADLAQRLLDMGCYQISLGDTIGTGTPGRTRSLIRYLMKQFQPKQFALHMHDTYGQALANIYIGLEEGITTFDTSVAGLGGCPYAKGASGNIASEDVAYMLDKEGFSHGIDIDTLCQTGEWISQQLKRYNLSRTGNAINAQRRSR